MAVFVTSTRLHQYKVGNLVPAGFTTRTDGTNSGNGIKMHPNLPAQDPNSVWTFDGTLPPKLLMARYGESILFRHYNALPIDVAANNGFGKTYHHYPRA